MCHAVNMLISCTARFPPHFVLGYMCVIKCTPFTNGGNLTVHDIDPNVLSLKTAWISHEKPKIAVPKHALRI